MTPTDANATVAVATTADGGATGRLVANSRRRGLRQETYTIHATVAESAPEDFGYTFDASTKTITGVYRQ